MMNHTNFAIDDPTNLRMMLNGSANCSDSIGRFLANLGSKTTIVDSWIERDDAKLYLWANQYSCPLPIHHRWFEYTADRDCAGWD